MSCEVGPDENHLRTALNLFGVRPFGYDQTRTEMSEKDAPAEAPTVPRPRSGGRLPAWWEKDKPSDLIDAAPVEDDEDAEEEEEEGSDDDDDSGWFKPSPGYWKRAARGGKPPKKRKKKKKKKGKPRPALSHGTRQMLYNAAAAGVGYWIGPAQTFNSWIEACGREAGIGAGLILGAGICMGVAVFWDSRTRHWYRPLAWVARIPLASSVLALALYAPASQI